MGQYYTPIITKDNSISTFNSWDYDNGLKLMEHSYIGNSFVETVLKQLFESQGHLAWVGDYAEVGDVENPLQEKFIKIANEEIDEYLKKQIEVTPLENSFNLIFLNHSKKEYISIKEYVFNNGKDEYGFIIHPIPLLTAIGNGKGGGDYFGKNENLVGRWACDLISSETYLDKAFEDYKNITNEIIFKEGR